MSDRPELGDDFGVDAAMDERRQLINVSYRMLGSLAEAEDIVQETYARWYAMSLSQRGAIESPGAWLTTVASRMCLNLLGSARVRRETVRGRVDPRADARAHGVGRTGGRATPWSTRPTR